MFLCVKLIHKLLNKSNIISHEKNYTCQAYKRASYENNADNQNAIKFIDMSSEKSVSIVSVYYHEL